MISHGSQQCDVFTNHGGAGDTFLTLCLKVWSGLLSTLSNPYPIRLFLMGYGCPDDVRQLQWISGRYSLSNRA